VLKGAARLEFEDRIVEMGAGDYINIQAHQKHRVASTTPDEPTIWLAVQYGGGEADIFPALKMRLTMEPSVFAKAELGNSVEKATMSESRLRWVRAYRKVF